MMLPLRMGRPGRPTTPVALSVIEAQTLRAWASLTSTPGARALSLRATIVLACAEGISNSEVTRRLGVSAPTVGKWRSRFLERRLNGLLNPDRAGVPRTIDEDLTAQIIDSARHSTAPDGAPWSTRTLAANYGISQSSVHRIWQAHGVQPLCAATPPANPASRLNSRNVGSSGRRTPDQIRRALLKAAEDVTAREGRAASFHDIARAAGVSRSVLYRHFRNRAELLQETALAPFVDFLGAFREISVAQSASAELSTWDMERAFISGILEHLDAHQPFLSTVLSERSAISHSLKAAFCASVDHALEKLAEVGAEEGRSHNRGVPLETISVKIRLVFALVAGISENRSWLIPAGQRAWSRDDLLDNLTEFTLYGVHNAPPTTPTPTIN
jgi:AcrR family transcriptional regulator/transposase